jgi:hypothetical protein
MLQVYELSIIYNSLAYILQEHKLNYYKLYFMTYELQAHKP